MVWLIKFWPDKFLLGGHPLLVNSWDWHLQWSTSLERKFSFQCFICFVFLKVLIATGRHGYSHDRLYVSNWLWNLHVGYGYEKLASYHAYVETSLKVRQNQGLPIYLPDSLNQPNNYSLPKNCLASKLKWNTCGNAQLRWLHGLKLSYITTQQMISLLHQLASKGSDLKRRNWKHLMWHL